jgi:glycosidase
VWDSIGAVMPYYPDQLHAHFAFEVSDAILDAVRTGSAKRLLPPVLRLQRALPAERWSPFLRNHDQTRTLTALGGDIESAKLAATILLTLPGLPYVYYGEEIGMTGDKPDPRLRTPMQWNGSTGVGFTRGKEWEAPQSDSARTNVSAESSDPASLLNLYGRLIHLRGENQALASGELISLDASSDSVSAYLRRAGDRVVLVVANLSATALSDVKLSSTVRVLDGGRYATRNLLGGRATRALNLGEDGLIRDYVPVQTLARKESLVLNLIARPQLPNRKPKAASDERKNPIVQVSLSLVTAS